MGWSCRVEASRTMDRFSDLCFAHSGQTNVWKAGAYFYMWEISRTEHRDGAITGRVFRFALGFDPQSREGGKCYPKGSVHINPDGTVARGPALLKQASREALAHERANPSPRLLPGSGGVRITSEPFPIEAMILPQDDARAREMRERAEAQKFFDDHVSFVVVGD